MATIIAVCVGMMLGSFLSVLLFRWPDWYGVIAGRSRCARCLRALSWYELIPLLSWIGLRGSCRHCAKRISVLYPLLEFMTAAVLGFYVYRFGILSVWSIIDCVILFGLIALLFFDLHHLTLPDVITATLTILIGTKVIGQQPSMLTSALLTGAGLAVAFGVLFLLSRGRWLGFGDVKLAFVIGFLFGFPTAVWVTFSAVWAGALVGIGMIVLKKANMKTALPFGAFWTAAALCAMIIG